jgi:putative transcriptional regulator
MTNRIKEFRARFNLTQDDLAKKANVRRETIVFLEKNKYNPSLKLAYDLAQVFGVAIEELFIFDPQND